MLTSCEDLALAQQFISTFTTFYSRQRYKKRSLKLYIYIHRFLNDSNHFNKEENEEKGSSLTEANHAQPEIRLMYSHDILFTALFLLGNTWRPTCFVNQKLSKASFKWTSFKVKFFFLFHAVQSTYIFFTEQDQDSGGRKFTPVHGQIWITFAALGKIVIRSKLLIDQHINLTPFQTK